MNFILTVLIKVCLSSCLFLCSYKPSKSYVLFQMSWEKLCKTTLPFGSYTKPQRSLSKSKSRMCKEVRSVSVWHLQKKVSCKWEEGMARDVVWGPPGPCKCPWMWRTSRWSLWCYLPLSSPSLIPTTSFPQAGLGYHIIICSFYLHIYHTPYDNYPQTNPYYGLKCAFQKFIC